MENDNTNIDNEIEEKNTSKEQDSKPLTESNELINKNKRLDPTRYGDWEKNGRCIDF